ncbi:hypothetical protein WJX72_011254 [[Myrmecia] bisecta]|uniref:Uncharacterized protein n=1 Tax=[Myrmecia] bisecta TaxID=41462 RepID=A0AAW1R9D0_9CHLO
MAGPPNITSELLAQCSSADPKGSTSSQLAFLGAFASLINALGGETYRRQFVSFREALDGMDPPDLVVIDAFGTPFIDLAHQRGLNYAIFYAIPLGVMAGFGDVPEAPHALLGELRAVHATSFTPRLRKAVVTPIIIFNTMIATTKLDTLRRELGVEPYLDPLTNWKGHLVLSTWSLGMDVARKLSPLTVMTGFAHDPKLIDPSASSVAEGAPSDRALWEWLSQHEKAGLVYIAFGSELPVTKATIRVLLEGAKAAVTSRGGKVLLALRADNWERAGVTDGGGVWRKREALVKQFRINVMGGGSAKRAADALEMALAVGWEHLLPVEEQVSVLVATNADIYVEEQVSFLVATNADIYALFAAVVLSTLGLLGWLAVKMLGCV